MRDRGVPPLSQDEIEEGKLVGLLMIDQSAAFDLCDHVILTGKVNLLLGGGEGVG